MPVSPKRLSLLVSELEGNTQWLFSGESDTLNDPLIHEVTLDIEEVRSGVLFIARRLWYVDTHQYLHEAIERGAAAIIVSDSELEEDQELHHTIRTHSLPVFWMQKEDPNLGIICDRFYEHPSSKLKVYGVTGTNGKTSAVSYLAQLLTAVGERVAVIGTVEYRFEDRSLAAPNTTPDALVIQRFLREALDLGATALALEVSSHALSLDRVAGLRFDAVGFTSFSRDHLDFHGTLSAYRDAKGRLFSDYLAYAQSEGKAPIAVAHGDSDGLSMLNRVPSGTRCIRCDVSAPQWGDLDPKEISVSNLGFDRLSLKIEGSPSLHGLRLCAFLEDAALTERTELSVLSAPLIGDYHPLNVAIALGMVAGTHPEHLREAWQSLSQSLGVSGRMERVISPSEQTADRVALVDYAHTPDAIKRALSAIRAVHTGLISVVIGCGGDRDRGKRPEMLRAALDGADKVWITSDNPRSEEPLQIINDALRIQRSKSEIARCTVVVDRRECLFEAWKALPVGGALLVTGKGHESYQEVKERRYLLSDQEAIIAAHYAEVNGLSHLNEVPLCESVLEIKGAVQAQGSTYDLSVLLIREASLRKGGLSLLVSMGSLSPVDLDTLPCMVKGDEVGHEKLIEQVWRLISSLKPRHRLAQFFCQEHETASRLHDLLSSMVEELQLMRPRPEVNLVMEDRSTELRVRELKDTTIGGWSRSEGGPKIPSLMNAR